MDNRRIIAASFFIIALSIGYYFVIFLPNKVQQEQKNLQDARQFLHDCLVRADTKYDDGWKASCKIQNWLDSNGKGDFDKIRESCILNTNDINRLKDTLKFHYDECHKIYPVK